MKRTITEGYMPYLGFRTYYRIVEAENTGAAKETKAEANEAGGSAGESERAKSGAGESTGEVGKTSNRTGKSEGGAEKAANDAGEAPQQPEKAALVLLHGGPGSTHTYMEVLDDLADTGRLVVSYDQLGCGNSWVEGHPELWNAQTWVDELKALREYLHLDRIHLLGQSWGGMLAIQYLIEEKPEGVKSVILSSTLPASWLWSHEQHRRIRFMSEEDQKAIREAEKTGNYETETYKRANAVFMERYCAGAPAPDAPECLKRPRRIGEESYLYAWGPNEYTPSGTLKDFDYTDRLHEINIPALVIDGTNDLCSPLIAKTMYDRIPDCRWELFDGARHMCFVEQHDHYEEILRPWLEEHD